MKGEVLCKTCCNKRLPGVTERRNSPLLDCCANWGNSLCPCLKTAQGTEEINEQKRNIKAKLWSRDRWRDGMMHDSDGRQWQCMDVGQQLRPTTRQERLKCVADKDKVSHEKNTSFNRHYITLIICSKRYATAGIGTGRAICERESASGFNQPDALINHMAARRTSDYSTRGLTSRRNLNTLCGIQGAA